MSETRIHALEVENFKRIKVLRLEPTATGLTIIGGRNGQGKTSVLDAIAAALGGAKKLPSNLRREGGIADPRVKVELGNGLTIERKGKNFDLHIRAQDGSKQGQRTLDGIIEEFALDIPSFMALRPAEKAERLLRILGIDATLKIIEAEEQSAYNEREVIGRQARQKEAAAKELPEYPDAPETLQTAEDLMASARALMTRNAERDAARRAVASLREQKRMQAALVEQAKASLSQAERQLAVTEAKLALAEQTPITANESDAEIQSALAEIEQTNAKVRSNLAKVRAQDDARKAQELYNELTKTIDAARAKRRALLDSAALPLPGLTVEKGELLYNGKAWDCMATSEQVKVSIAIAHALKPACCFVLLDRLESFDQESLRELDAWLADLGMQGIATRVSTGAECSVVIEDGAIEGQETAIAPETGREEKALDASEEISF